MMDQSKYYKTKFLNLFSTFLFFMGILTVIEHKSNASPAQLPPPREKIEPQVVVHFKDAELIHNFLKNNPSARSFIQSNLYRGLFYRLSPIFGMLSGKNGDNWKGRLLDFAYEKIMDKHGLSFAYFPQESLNSPFGTSFSRLSEIEYSILASLTKAFTTGTSSIVLNSSEKSSSIVSSLQIQNQKFAQASSSSCLSLSRDPYIATYLSRSCLNQIQSDAEISINLDQLMPALRGIYRRFFSQNSNVKINVAYDKTKNLWEPQSIIFPLHKDNQFKKGLIPAGFFAASPSSTSLLLTGTIPDPQSYSPENLRFYLSETPQERLKRPSLAVAFLSFWDEGSLQSAILIGRDATLEELEGMRLLFMGSERYDVSFARICSQFIAISPNPTAIEAMNKSCEGSLPSLLNLSEKSIEKLHKLNPEATLFVNIGKLLSETYRKGLASLNNSPDEGSPPIKEALRLFDQIPYYFFAGDVESSSILLKEVN
ncbi:MAG: hypothetical protein KDD35_03905 [Bdellovibrionales bacterium]|nr:hypothetical protein [Bdellovibrionales bacterium]